MPHIHIDYSGNLEGLVDMGSFVEALRVRASEIEAFPLAGIRVRASRVDYYAIADGNVEHGFIDILVRLREGRSEAVKKDAIARLFECAKEELAPVMSKHPIALSAEIKDINGELSPKYGTIRDHL